MFRFQKETVQRVENAAEELGYELPKRKHAGKFAAEKLLVVLCPNLTNPYYVMLLQGIESRATEQGFGLFVCNTPERLRAGGKVLKDDAGSESARGYLCM